MGVDCGVEAAQTSMSVVPSRALLCASTDKNTSCAMSEVTSNSEFDHRMEQRVRAMPRPCLQFQKSDEYLKQHIVGMLEDLAGCMNFEVISCCAWHSAQSHLKTFIDDLGKMQECSDWKPEAAWQCSNCGALI